MLTESESITEKMLVSDLTASIEHYVNELGYRLDMIFPADNLREALLSIDDKSVRLVLENHPVGETPPPLLRKEGSWITGRAGMQYRDLVPDRLGGRLIASHIRLTAGGPVPDYVHYHKVEFQMIYCYRGRVKVVYEDQGPPFWLEPGDCVLQPPEIRHRVLEAEAGTEVIEIGVPAVHETWVEHDIELPTGEIEPGRVFGGQRFVRHVSADAQWDAMDAAGFVSRDTGISNATAGFADVRVVRSSGSDTEVVKITNDGEILLIVSLDGTLTIGSNGAQFRLEPVGAFTVEKNAKCTVVGENGSFLLIKMGSNES